MRIHSRHCFPGTKPFLMGDQPIEVDCAMFGMLAQILWNRLRWKAFRRSCTAVSKAIPNKFAILSSASKKMIGSAGGPLGGPGSSQRYTGLSALKKLINHGVPAGLLRGDQRTDGDIAAACPAPSRSVDTQHQRRRAAARSRRLRPQGSRPLDPAPGVHGESAASVRPGSQSRRDDGLSDRQPNVGQVVHDPPAAFGWPQEPDGEPTGRQRHSNATEVQLSSADVRLGETESGLRRRRIRRRAQQRRSLTDPRPPPNDEELRWKSRQRYSDDSGSESDDEQHLAGSRYHQQQQRPNLSQYVSDGGAPGTGGSGGDGSGRDEGSSSRLNNMDAVHLEPIVKLNEIVSDLAVRSQSILSNVGTESSGQKDSGFSDLLGRSEEDTKANASAVVRRTDSSTMLDHIRMSPPPSSERPSNDVIQGGDNLNQTRSNRSSGSLNNPTTTHSPLMDDVESSRKRTFLLLRRTKSERHAEENGGSSPNPPITTNAANERVKYKADIPISVVRDAQAKTRRYNLERKIFQQLLDLKQMQIRIGQANEQLRLVQGGRTLLPLVDSPTEREDIQQKPGSGVATYGEMGSESVTGSRTMPVDKCTHTTQRCPHAMYAYTTLPPACYTGLIKLVRFTVSVSVPYHKHHKPVNQQQPLPGNASNGTAKSMTENGRIILPKLNLNNNNNQKNLTNNKSSN
ncbi:hypothetical protein GHT06_014513 [Daphnia sinensis]|uniref:Metaxin glutathione S-transferase domain-containing protein n=1 Tax=Daphnia sinensis TaxID=1820382 RepID=A0AAD5L9E7_9CRUS|nr:hypothetical protein GHT06_014513 [Daphnia sinensis]